MKFIKDISGYVIIIIIVVLIRTFIVTPVRVDGPSMDNTLKDSDLLLLNKFSYIFTDIKRYDIAVVENNGEKIIKRVYGLPGDSIEYKDNKLYINGKLVEDKYATNETADFNLTDICIAGLRKNKMTTETDIENKCNYNIIPDGYYLVLGDNRKVSADSRYYGLIPKNKIVGKTKIRFWPLNKIGIVK